MWHWTLNPGPHTHLASVYHWALPPAPFWLSVLRHGFIKLPRLALNLSSSCFSFLRGWDCRPAVPGWSLISSLKRIWCWDLTEVFYLLETSKAWELLFDIRSPQDCLKLSIMFLIDNTYHNSEQFVLANLCFSVCDVLNSALPCHGDTHEAVVNLIPTFCPPSSLWLMDALSSLSQICRDHVQQLSSVWAFSISDSYFQGQAWAPYVSMSSH